MTNTPSLRQLFEIGCKNAARLFRDEGSVMPIWHAVPGDAKANHLLIATPWGDDDEKEIALDVVRDMFKEHQVQRFVCVVEAWVVKGADPKALFAERPSQHPDRREVIRIQAEDRDGSVLSGMYYILRPEHGPATLSELHEDPPDMVLAGRMMGLLDPASPATRH